MELLPRRLASAGRAPVIAQLADHQLAHRVVEIRGIESTTIRLLLGGALVLHSLLEERLPRLLDRHTFRMQPDRGDKSHIAKQRFLKLSYVHFRIASTE